MMIFFKNNAKFILIIALICLVLFVSIDLGLNEAQFFKQLIG